MALDLLRWATPHVTTTASGGSYPSRTLLRACHDARRSLLYVVSCPAHIHGWVSKLESHSQSRSQSHN
eukprot:365960-Chlamydomonas_euryale.AAC.5